MFPVALLLLISAPLGLATPTPTPDIKPRNCGSLMAAADVAVAEAHFAAHKVLAATKLASRATTTVKVYWHVVSKDMTAAGGNVPDSQIANQIKTLNADYAGSSTSWVLAGTTRTVNADWFNNAGPSSTQQTAMKNQLRQGGKGDLNVYSVGFVSGSGSGLLGYSTYPISYSSTSKEDGIVILFSSVPGGTTYGYNLGRTLTHESGHWMGLYHTFQGGCAATGSSPTASGDFVADTPAEASPASGCPTGRDTCTNGTLNAGADPIRNFMDYTQDSCMNAFTQGQFDRMKAQFATYRSA
ncbi:metalloprotease [Mycena filopes]|nr:metalloprotease [Mycena filopes]